MRSEWLSYKLGSTFLIPLKYYRIVNIMCRVKDIKLTCLLSCGCFESLRRVKCGWNLSSIRWMLAERQRSMRQFDRWFKCSSPSFSSGWRPAKMTVPSKWPSWPNLRLKLPVSRERCCKNSLPASSSTRLALQQSNFSYWKGNQQSVTYSMCSWVDERWTTASVMWNVDSWTRAGSNLSSFVTISLCTLVALSTICNVIK